MSERTMEKARQVVHRLSEWYFAEGGDNDPDSPIDREDLDALHELVRTAEATLRTPRGEGEGDALGMLQASVDEYLWEAQNNPQFDAEAAFAALSREIRAALRSEAQGAAEALAALVVRIWTRCQNEGPQYRETDEFWADFRRAYELAAARTNGGSDG